MQPCRFLSAGNGREERLQPSCALVPGRGAPGDSLAWAWYNLGIIYLFGSGVPPNMDAARKWLELAANQGYAPAQYKLGWSYATGNELQRDLDKARYWLRLAAAQAEPLAIYALGVMAATGQGETQDNVAAFAFLTSSAKHGYREALAARNQIAAAMTVGAGVKVHQSCR